MISPSLAPECIAFSTPIASVLMTRFVLALMERSARNSKPEVDAATGAHVAKYPVAIRAAGWILLVLDGAAALGIAIYQGNHGAPFRGILLGSLLFAIMVATVVEFTRVRVEWTDTAIDFASPWASPRRLAWSDIVQVKYSASARWFVLRGGDGTKIRLHCWLGGLRQLLDEMKSRASADVKRQVETAMRPEFPS